MCFIERFPVPFLSLPPNDKVKPGTNCYAFCVSIYDFIVFGAVETSIDNYNIVLALLK
jgi:hypothetical protein